MENKESTFNTLVSPVIVLVAICLACSALLAVLNSVTAPIIKENERVATLAAYLSVLPEGIDAASLEEVPFTTAGVSGAVKAPDGSVAIKAAASGYSGKDVTVYVAFDASGVVTGMQVDASTQTAGIGSKCGGSASDPESFASGYLGWDAANNVEAGSPVDTIGGATYTSKAVYVAMNSAIDCFNNEIKGVA